MAHRALHSTSRAILLLSVPVFAACVPLPAVKRTAEPERSMLPRRNCTGLLVEATTALTSTAADTSVAAIMTAHVTHAGKMAEYHSCLAEDP